MASDISLILQLLQRQLSQVPPAYSPISPSSHNLSLYSISLRSMEPAPPLEEEELTPTDQVRGLGLESSSQSGQEGRA